MKNIRTVLISVILLLSIFLISAVAQGGFDEYGFNFKARVFNGLLGNADRDGDPDTYYESPTFPTDSLYPLEYVDADGKVCKVLIDVEGAQLVGKWSKGLLIGGRDEVGAWRTYHIKGTGKIYDEDENIIYEGRLVIFCKIQKVSANEELITQLVINGQGVVAKEMPPGFGIYILKGEDGEIPEN